MKNLKYLFRNFEQALLNRRQLIQGAAVAATAASFPRFAAAQQQQQARRFRYSKPVIDAHVHWYPPEFAELVEKEGAQYGVKDIRRNENGEVQATVPGNHPYAPRATFRKELTDHNAVLKMADDRNVAISVLTQTNPHILWAQPQFGAKLARAINDSTSAFHAKYPNRILGTIILPMQDVKLSLEELERAHKLPGMRAVNITENILGRNLSDKEFWPVYARCEQLGLPIFLHNVDPISERLVEKDYSMINVLGNPFEATIAATALVLGGVMDEFPKLDVYMPHAGGFFAFVTPRMDWSMGTAEYFQRGRTNSFRNLKQPRASDYRRRFHYDLILHSPQIMRYLIDLVGADRVVSGTDFPQGMAVMKPIEYVETIPGITQKEAELILCENPARLLKL
ncbi:MAG: amidohydrolase [Acidobacteria bacterium]|nr:amidohydrolase [Acidobacteriota bacterium]